MTARSKRRDRELAVIDAAVRWRIAHPYRRASALEGGGGYAPGSASADLCDAVDAYTSHELMAPFKVRTNLRSPDTSHEAGEWAKQFALTDAGMVFRHIYSIWRHRHKFQLEMYSRRNVMALGIEDDGMTSDEIEETTGRTHQSISARVNELKNTGWIIDSGIRRKTRSGGNAIVWTPTQAAREFVDKHGMPIPVEPR